MLLTFLLHSSTAFTLARAPVLNGHPLAPATRARHHAVVAREIAFVAQSEARCEPFTHAAAPLTATALAAATPGPHTAGALD